MTTKILSGIYSSGYTLAAGYSGVDVTKTGAVDGVEATYGGYPVGRSGGVALTLPNGGALTNGGVIQGGAGGGGANVIAYYNNPDPGSGLPGMYYIEQQGAPGGPGEAGVAASATAHITNLGAIIGGAGGKGGLYGFAATQLETTPLPDGYAGPGILLQAGGAVINFGTIEGGPGVPADEFPSAPGTGVVLAAGGRVANGDASHRSALIEGGLGVSVVGIGTVINFGTIDGITPSYQTQGAPVATAVQFGSTSGVLIAEGGSTFIGSVIGGGGTLQLRAGATGTIDGISGFGKVSFATGASWVFEGDNEIPTGLAVHPGGTITVDGTLATHGLIAADVTVAGELAVAGGNALSLIGGTLTNLAGGTLTGGTFMVGAGERLQLADNAPITTLGATIELLGAKATVESLNTLSGREVGLRSSLTAIGAAGVLEIAGGASFALFNSIANDGTIEALGGTVSLAGAVSGTGSVEIGGGGIATIAGAFAQNVSFAAGTGELKLGKSQGYTGTISGFSTTGADSLDLADIGFTSGTTTASFSGTTASGVLTVTDGTHTAQLNFIGDYTGSTWTLSSDGHGGTKIVDPTAPGPTAAPLATAMAGFAPDAAATTRTPAALSPTLAHPLAAPRSAMAP